MPHDAIIAKVQKHRIELPPDVDWPDEMEVRLQPVVEKRLSVWEVMKKWEGIADDLPEDLAENHDHYIHGTPKRKK